MHECAEWSCVITDAACCPLALEPVPEQSEIWMIERWIDKKEMVDCVWRSEHIGKEKRKKDRTTERRAH